MLGKLKNFIKRNERTIKKLPLLSWHGGVYRYLLDTKNIGDKQIQEIIKEIETYQRADGGFQIETKGSSSSVIETAITVDFLLDLGMSYKSEIIVKAVEFLISNQCDDGGFAENSNIKHPNDWDEKYIYEKRVSTPHITAWVLRALLKAKFPKKNPSVRKALKYLATHQKKDGGWSHFKSERKSCPYLTGLILIALGEFREFRDTVDFNSLTSFYFDKQKNNGSIGDCLDASLLVAEAWANMGIDINEPHMRKLLEWIKQQQNSDGSFIDKDCGWPDTLENRVSCSMNILRIIYKTGWGR